ncbi:conserved hypothetical protein [Chlamydia pneumoniae LPCoLN]|uniref:DUF3604 domain-containing protein n=1 Tax=Chlamydia pneumoniae TaxID=83558 RepID=UPI0001BD9E72|nr:DUF3604 domain-containing protein [Chlamydia pneumoniae]ACZ33488.1 conserved hypothetical protein [Chlamydia pneumoniae LPCoLN]ETR80413.1 hypothetical protein X556_0271 [Chlamydia pneumoniae B21]
MRRSVCYVNPSIARAGQISTWKFLYSLATPLPAGTKCKFDLAGSGKPTDWEAPATDLSQTRNVIYAEMPEGEIIEATAIPVKDNPVPQFEFTLPYELQVGETLTIVMGASPNHPQVDDAGNGAQLFAQRRKPFYLYIDPTGEGNYDEPDVFSMDIRGNVLKKIEIFTPSYVVKNKRFDITVRFEDEFGNLTNFSPEDTRIELSYEHLRENLNWQLFIPETGFVILPNLYFNEPGIYRIQLKNLSTQEIFISAPIKCFADSAPNLMWGLLHGESERVDSEENIETCMRYFRDDRALNFYASSSFENQENLSPDIWKLINQTVSDFNEEDRFITLSGFQYSGEPHLEGVRHILHTKETKSHSKHKEYKHIPLAKLYKSTVNHDMISIPSFTASKEHGFDFENFYPEFERVVEIYNAWGSSETTAALNNPFPIQGKDSEDPRGTVIEGLKKNLRFGFVAGGLDDRGIYKDYFDSPQVQYSPGLTAIICNKYTRESLVEALFARHCYATTGPRIVLSFNITSAPMGSELSTGSKPGLNVNRHISGHVAGTALLKTVEIIRNGEVLHTFFPDSNNLDYEYDDMVPLSSVTLKDPNGKAPFVFYYLRVTQADNAMAWSSPIWVDLN